jgi:hypothetical protein
LSESQKQLLKTMLFYDLQNYVLLEIERLRLSGVDTSELDTVKKYMEKRIRQLETKQ